MNLFTHRVDGSIASGWHQAVEPTSRPYSCIEVGTSTWLRTMSTEGRYVRTFDIWTRGHCSMCRMWPHLFWGTKKLDRSTHPSSSVLKEALNHNRLTCLGLALPHACRRHTSSWQFPLGRYDFQDGSRYRVDDMEEGMKSLTTAETHVGPLSFTVWDSRHPPNDNSKK